MIMPKILSFFLLILLLGCASTSDNPIQQILADPSSERHQQKLDTLESSYLKGETSYGDYQRRLKDEEERFGKEIDKREDMLLAP